MDIAAVPASAGEAVEMLESALGLLASVEPAGLPSDVLGAGLRALERADAVGAAVRGRFLEAFDAQDGHLADGQRTSRAWLVHCTGITRGQAGEHKAVQKLAREHPVLWAALAEGHILSKSAGLQVATWTRAIPGEFRDQAEEIVVAAARAGAGLRALAAICAEIRYRTAPGDPDGDGSGLLDRGVSLERTFEGAGVIHGDLTPQCAAMVEAVLDALAAPQGGADTRTRPQRYHDALEDAMRRLLASNLLPQRAGQPVKALVHISFADLCAMDQDSAMQATWITSYRAAWAAHRAAASVSTGDGGVWLDGDAARAAARDAIIVPVVIGEVDVNAIEDLITLCARYHRIRTSHPAEGEGDGHAAYPDSGDALGDTVPDAAAFLDAAELEREIIGKVLSVVSGPGGVASFLRRALLGKGLSGPSLPLDVGRTDEVPVHLRRLVALRDQQCQFAGGCDQPAAACEAHHAVHRSEGGITSLANLGNYCWWHHHVLFHRLGWKLTAYPDGTSRVTSPNGKTIRSHSPPPWPKKTVAPPVPPATPHND